MKKFFISIAFVLTAWGYQSYLYGQQKDYINWYNGKGAGMQTDKAYKKLKKRKSQTVIVAVIDSGIDIEHKDLEGRIWVNEKEIPNNGKDDDNNGYIDDIHGWNFLGNSKGQNQNDACLEKTRIYKRLRDKYEKVETADISKKDMEEYKLYKKVKQEIKEESERYEMIMKQLEQLPMILKMVPDMVKNAMGKSEYTLKDLQNWKPESDDQEQIKNIAIAMETGELTEAVVEEQKAQIEGMLKYNLNPDFNDREFVGDDPYDFTDTKYGNNDVEGPDALHGTHVGGIIAAIRGNNLGGDGVATDVRLMSLRAVPNGDEHDKDIALAIRYAVDNGASVINMSFGKAYSPNQKEVFEAMKYADSKGVLLVHAAGNDNANVDETDNFPTSMYPFQSKKLDHYLTIGASTRFKTEKLAASFSNYGATKVDVFAPGHDIYNAVPQSDYKKLNGTSMAAPMVSGVAALLKSYFPSLSMKEIKDIMLASATSYKDTQQFKPGTEDLVKFGTLSVTGAVINVKAAVAMCIQKEKSKS
ncbi:MAG: peptidase S8 [Bacteroidetes bacterium]|nr:MAG: peptidase S8 [Bacteroidota bacterium]